MYSRVYEPPETPGYFDKYVWPPFVEHRSEIFSQNPNIIRLNGLAYDENFRRLSVCIEGGLSNDWILLSRDPLSVQSCSEFVTAPTCGAISVFAGTTRNNFDGKPVLHLEYDAYETMAELKMREICRICRDRWPTIQKIAMHHRLGAVPVCEASVIIAVSSPHRIDAQSASQFAIDQLKAIVPIWKKEVYGNGFAEWKENVESIVKNEKC